MAITKALSDPNRVRILLALKHGELCVCQITELFGFAPSTVSRHLSILHHAHLILSRKSERWVYYRLDDPAAPERHTTRWEAAMRFGMSMKNGARSASRPIAL